MAEIGVAVIGFGLAGQVFHAPFVSAVPGLKLEAIVQRKGDEAAQGLSVGADSAVGGGGAEGCCGAVDCGGDAE